MSDFRQEPSLDAVRLSDEFVDALAGGGSVAPHDVADSALAALLCEWRDEMRWPPATGLVSEPQAVAALNAGLSDKGKRDPMASLDTPLTAKRRQRGLSTIGAAAAAVLCVGGFGAVVSSAGPGDALYGLRTMVFGTPKQVREDQFALAARTELDQVQELIAQGDWQHAQEKLVAVSSQVESIDDVGQKQELVEQFNDLSAKVVGRDPAATAPPGITYTVSTSSTALVQTVSPTSVPSAPSSTETTSGESSSSDTTAPSETASSGETATSEAMPASETPAAATSTASGSPTPSASPAQTTTPTASASPAQTTTPTSAAPGTTTPKVSSLVPTSAGTAPEVPPNLAPLVTTTVVVAPVG